MTTEFKGFFEILAIAEEVYCQSLINSSTDKLQIDWSFYLRLTISLVHEEVNCFDTAFLQGQTDCDACCKPLWMFQQSILWICPN